MKTIHDLSSLVTQHPLKGEPACPQCGGEYTQHALITTLFGWSGKGEDPNHTWESCVCNNCSYKFQVERKSGNAWITQAHKVLAGLPNCFESYIYTCKHCNGDVTRNYTTSDGQTDITTLQYSRLNGPQYRTFYTCKTCKQRIEVTS